MMNTSHRFTTALVLSLAFTIIGGAPSPGRENIVSAQASNACALVTVDDVEPLAGTASVADGVLETAPKIGYETCRYAWGVGTGRFKLDVVVSDASRVFPGAMPEQMKQLLQGSIRAGTYDEVLSDIGEAAVFKPESVVYASATALVKGRIVQVHLDGVFARDRKDQVVGLLKTAASRM